MANSQLARAVRIALLSAGVAGFGLTGATAFAQTDTQRAQAPVDEVVVTGTRIRSPGLVSTSPISSVDQVEINLRQPAAVEDFIKQLPAAVPAIGPGTNNGANGGATISLRGLGSGRNLVLVDGRRLVPFNLNGQVDTNAIPVGMIQRVDLVTGGASAVYGADAVSGVVNFILRRDFEGIDASATYGTSEEGDADMKRVDVTIGANTPDGRGNVTMGLGYTKRDLLRQGDRPIGAASLSSVTGNPDGSANAVPLVVASGVAGMGFTGAATYDPALGAFRQYVASTDAFNFNPLNLFVAPLERTQFTAIGHYEINRHAEVFAQTMFTDSYVAQNLAPSGSFGGGYQLPVSNPFLTDAARTQLCAISSTPIANCAAGSTEIMTGLNLARRFTELGPRLGDFDNKLFQYTGGIRGEITSNWDYEASWTRGQADQLRVLGNWGSRARVQQALLATSPTACTNTAGGCVPLNLFGAEGTITPAMIDFFNLSALQQQRVVQEVGSAFVSGDLGDFTSPWAAGQSIGVAFGVEHRRVSAGTLSDDASQIQGEILGTGAPTPDRAGSFKLDEAYAEILAPLVADAPFIRSLQFEAGIRHTEFEVSEGGSHSYQSWKAGLAWEPIDSLRVRTMYQRATRAPNVNELFAPQVTGLSNLAQDPCQGNLINQADANTPGTLSNLCRLTGVPVSVIGNLGAPQAGQINVLTGGNAQLGPEKADTLTVGFVWQPDFVQGLTVTLDYYNIEINDAITSPSATDVLQGCYSATLNPNRTFNDLCALVGRSPTAGDLNQLDADGVGLALSNLGTIKTTGLDLGAFYGFDLPNPQLGSLSFALNVNHTNNWNFQANPAAVNRNCVGYYSVACSGNIYEWKGNLRTTWSFSDFDVSLNYRYLHGLDVEPGSAGPAGWLPGFDNIGSYSYFDLTGVWQVVDNVRLTLTVNNLLDRDAKNVGNTIGATATNSGNTFPQWYDVIGRYYTLGVNVSF